MLILLLLLMILSASLGNSLHAGQLINYHFDYYLSVDCQSEDSERVQRNTLEMPKDGRDYRYVSHHFEELTKNFHANYYQAEYSRLKHSLSIEVKAYQHDECWFLGPFKGGPVSWVGARLHFIYEVDACEDPDPIPTTDRVQPYIDAYNARLSGIQCHIKRSRNAYDDLVAQYTHKLEQKVKKKYGTDAAIETHKRLQLASFQRVNEKYLLKAKDATQSFVSLFREYSQTAQTNTEILKQRLVTLATTASKSVLEDIPNYMNQLSELSQKEAAESVRYLIKARRIFGELEGLQVDYEMELDALRPFIRDNGLYPLRLADDELNALNKLILATSNRNRTFTDSVRVLISQLQRKESILMSRKIDQSTRKTLGLSIRMAASQKFLDTLIQQSATLWSQSEFDLKTELPRFEKSYLNKRAFMRNQDLCLDAEQANDWRKQGCMAIDTELSRVDVYLRKTFPRRLREHAEKRSLTGVIDKLRQNQLLEAAREFDQHPGRSR